MKWLRDNALNIYAGLAVAYMLIPIAVIAVFSFNDPAGRYNFTWERLHARSLEEPVRDRRSSPTRWSPASSWPRSRR